LASSCHHFRLGAGLRRSDYTVLRPVLFVAFLFAGALNPFAVCLTRAQSNSETSSDFAQFRPRKELPGEQFAGRAACAGCHSEKTHSQTHTSMARALFIPSQSAVLKSHPRLTYKSGIYSYEIVTDSLQTLYRVTDGKETLSEPILYAFGNARIAQTFVFRHNGKLQEGRVSYYAAIGSLDWTIGDVLSPPPSLEEAAGRDIDSAEARNCFSCHGTAATVDYQLRLDRVVPGVSCEACHGPAAAHVAAMNAGDTANPRIFNPMKLPPEKLSQEFCGACHRSVDAVAMMPNLGGIGNVRFQPYRLFNSRGHDPNNAHFACTACHDPHIELTSEASSYDANCTGCHAVGPADANSVSSREQASASTSTKPVAYATHKSSAAFPVGKPCPIAKERCVTCHMPKVELPGAHYKFTDHRIRIVHPGDPYPY
jgi:hypothetical protein